MNDEKKLALLIDSDNVSAKYAQFIVQEASKYGELIIKRIYGDWEKNNSGWRIPAMNNSIMPVQQNSYIAGKNATDFSMIIDAMDILYTCSVDGFVLVTSDSDFTRLAIRLREAGKLVVGIGEVKTPLAFTSSCHKFSYLNRICANVSDDYDEKTLRRAVLDYVRDNDDGRLDLMKIDSYLTSRYGNIDYAALGYNRLSMFISSFPELRRSSNFVTLRKGAAKAKPAESAPSEADITNVIVEYLKRQGGRDDISRVQEYITKNIGKIDFSQFGSKRFARFIDKQSALTRENNTVALKSAESAPEKPIVEKISGKPIEEIVEKIAKKQPAKPVEAPSAPARTMHINPQIFSMEVQKYAAENMPNGGNLGQLNNMLLEKYGKNYVSELGAADFAAAVASVSGVTAAKNLVYTAQPEKPETAENQPKKRGRKPKNAEKPEEKTVETPAAEVAEPEEPAAPQKPDINSVIREVHAFAAQNENNGPLAVLGGYFTKKYGRGYLKELGFTTMKKLIASVIGVSVKNDLVVIDDDFLERTERIEQFVNDFARGEGSHSIKALSAAIKKSFEGFDFADYGYARFSDFINAIDGVRADRYHVVAVD
ncbi:MAG: NYN domain-containing protein [Lachnospiraceae bacterium]|nr:NYN domain-containing protein [Ruminococcus sp.]MCM1275990.1 NYN domain-containing protein [Lachnospiraceae bacterium]